jgi:hypothetical protein
MQKLPLGEGRNTNRKSDDDGSPAKRRLNAREAMGRNALNAKTVVLALTVPVHVDKKFSCPYRQDMHSSLPPVLGKRTG